MSVAIIMHATLLSFRQIQTLMPLYSFIQRPTFVHRHLHSNHYKKTSVVQLHHQEESSSSSFFSLDDINMASSTKRKKEKNKKAKSDGGNEISIVGPDCIHVLQGQLFDDDHRIIEGRYQIKMSSHPLFFLGK